MVNLFIDIIELSIPVSVLIAVLLAFSPLLKRAYVAKWRYYMWLFVAVRLLLPFHLNFKSPITMEIPAATAQAASTGVSALQIAAISYLAGVMVFALYRVICYISFKRLTDRWQSEITDEVIYGEFRAAKEFARVKRNIAIKRCKAVSTPMIFGIIKPVLLMPDVEFTSEELSIVLRHELVHLKRHDILYKLLIMLACTVYWFNPMVYIMSKAANNDLELACDAEVVKAEDGDFRCRYCEAIMRLVHNKRGAGTALSTCFIFSKKTVMERFKYILDEKIKRSGVIMFCAVAFSFVISGGMVSFATERVAEEFEENLQILERETPVPKATEPPQSTDIPMASREIQPEDTYSYQPYTAQEEYTVSERAPVYETRENTVSSAAEVEKGADRETVYDRLGEPDAVSTDGSRETYNLSDGSTAVLQYDDGVLDSGYILVN